MPSTPTRISLGISRALASSALALLCARAAAHEDLTRFDLATLMQMNVTLVTAQKRTENLASVPISMTVLKADAAARANLDMTYDLQRMVPGLTTSSTLGFMLPYIRGVGTDNLSQVEPSVSVYVDDVYRTDRSQTFVDLSEVEQIEVLKGPQGTLYGRNATGGAIKITTRGPSERLTGSARVSAGSLDLRDGSLFIAGPVHERVRASFASHVREKDSYYRNIVGTPQGKSEDFHALSSRVQIDLAPGLDAELLLKYLRRNDGMNGITEISGNSVPARMGIPVATAPLTSAVDTVAANDFDNINAAVKLNWSTPLFAVRSITAHNQARYRSRFDTDGSAAPLVLSTLASRMETLTQELQLSPAQQEGRFDWLAGVFYMNTSLANKPYSNLIRNSTLVTFGETRTDARAVFGEVAVHLTDAFELIAGLRLSHESKGLFDAAAGNTGEPLRRYPDNRKSWDNLSYRLVAKYSLEQSMLYAKTETAFKAGTFNFFSPADEPTSPERIASYEVGAKHAFATLPLRMAAAAFYNDYRNQQLQMFNMQTTVTDFSAAPAAETYGLDASIELKAGDHVSFDAGVEWLDAAYDRFVAAGVLVPNPAGGHMFAVVDLDGKRFARSPDVTARVGAAFDYPLAHGNVFGSLNYYRSGRMYFDIANLYSQDAFGLLQASLGYRARCGWEISGWGKNLTDERYLTGAIVNRMAASGLYGEPRTYGINIGYSFGP